MKKNKTKTSYTGLALVAAIAVGLINSATAVVAYKTFAPSEQQQTFIANDSGAYAGPADGTLPAPTDQASPTNATAQVTQPSAKKSSQGTATPTKQIVRKPDTPIAVGQRPQPAQVVTDAQGSVTYKWCSGTNPALEDGVCAAIISVAANPSASNQYLGPKAKKSLSLLPPNTTFVMDESSWRATSANSGTIAVTAKTAAYGDIRLLLQMEKNGNTWIVADGQLT